MLSIGEFSKLCLVTTKTLRHYDLIGLLKPQLQNPENGYRYYSIDQLSTMMKIIRLRNYDFSLEEIKTLIYSDSQNLCSAMKAKASEKELNLQQENLKLAQIKADIMDLEKGDFMKTDLKITTVQTEDKNIAFIKDTISIKDFCKLMERLYALGLPMEGAPIALYHSPEFNPDSTIIEVAFPTSVKNENTRTLKGGLCAKCIHYGNYSNLPNSYAAMVKWIDENNFKIVNPPYEVYLNDPAKTKPDELVTEIYFPIENK